MTIIRRFNSEGIKQFQVNLRLIEDGSLETVPTELLYNDRFSEPLPQSLEIENRTFPTRYDAAVYLHTILGSPEKQE